MLGHKPWRATRAPFDTFVTVLDQRGGWAPPREYPVEDVSRAVVKIVRGRR